jgi:DNA-binding transcriptional LysR family regulator
MDNIELRELRVFLVLADELHFGHTAARLGLTQSRVSQSLRSLERKLGRELVHRTSRRVALTPAGETFLAEVRPAYDDLNAVLDRTHEASRSVEGKLRLGLLTAPSAGPHMPAIIDAFEDEYQDCQVEVSVLVDHVPIADIFGPLRRCEIDVMATWLPHAQPDLVVGPTLTREARVLAVARDHPLAERTQVSIEDLADYEVAAWLDGLPREMVAGMWVPFTTPTGRPIRRSVRHPIPDEQMLLSIALYVARGELVHPTYPSVAKHWGHPNIVYVPIADMPEGKSGLVWPRRSSDPRLRAFIPIARNVLQSARRKRPVM